MVSLLNTLLDLEGYEVVAWQGEAPLLDAVQAARPDLLLLDVHLKKGNGLDLVRDLQSQDALAGMRVLMSSGMDLKETCLEAGADDFIQKPFMPEELIEKVKSLLSNEADQG